MAEEQIRREPEVVTDTANLSREDWLAYRRQGIGGSDAAAVLGLSPFKTARDLYYDKLNAAPTETDDENWVQKEVGRLLEDLVAKIFRDKTGYPVGDLKKMYRHPEYPFMLADIDYLVKLPDGSFVILEVKTTNYNARGKWWDGAREIVPLNYELQGRHYMAVLNLKRVYFCCLYGNNDDEVIIRRIDRDMALESELIASEEHFWTNHVLAQIPPPYTEDGDLVVESVRRQFGRADTSAPELVLNERFSPHITRYLELQREKSSLDAQVKTLDSELKRIRGAIAAEMGNGCLATCTVDGTPYAITHNPILRPMIDKDALARLRERLPEVYSEYVTVSEGRRFAIKAIASAAESEAA